jgi:hypothetical protein
MKMAACFFLAALSVSASAQDKGTEQVYGKGVVSTELVRVSSLLDNASTFVGKTVAVEGKVVDVCAKRGCWIELASDRPFEKIRVKVDDGVIVFPLELRGKTARAEGTLEAIDLTKEDAIKHFEHLAEERGESFDPSTVIGPMKIYRIKGTGALVR